MSRAERNAYARKWYAENRDRIRPQRAAGFLRRRAERRAFVDVRKAQPCVDCGSVLEPRKMHFDHVRGTKVDTISNLVRDTVPYERIEDEIAKCELRCVGCHTRRHNNAKEGAK